MLVSIEDRSDVIPALIPVFAVMTPWIGNRSMRKALPAMRKAQSGLRHFRLRHLVRERMTVYNFGTLGETA